MNARAQTPTPARSRAAAVTEAIDLHVQLLTRHLDDVADYDDRLEQAHREAAQHAQNTNNWVKRAAIEEDRAMRAETAINWFLANYECDEDVLTVFRSIADPEAMEVTSL